MRLGSSSRHHRTLSTQIISLVLQELQTLTNPDVLLGGDTKVFLAKGLVVVIIDPDLFVTLGLGHEVVPVSLTLEPIMDDDGPVGLVLTSPGVTSDLIGILVELPSHSLDLVRDPKSGFVQEGELGECIRGLGSAV